MTQDNFCLDRSKLRAFEKDEVQRFQQKIPKSRALFQESRSVMPSGVPAAWMAAFYPGTEMFIAKGSGCYFEDVDGNKFLDMTQCDLSMVCGFGPEPVARAVAKQFSAGSHFLLPTEDAIATSRLLADRYHLPFWQYTLSASVANSEAIRISRYATGREKVLIFQGKYHGHIDETLVSADAERLVPDQLGLPKNVTEGTVVVPFNDLEVVEKPLKRGDIACVLTEPVLTNVGVVLPDDGFHSGLRDLTRKYETILIIDETHTQAAAYGGFTNTWQLEPDILTLGKCVGGGVPFGAYGLSQDLGKVVEDSQTTEADGRKNIALGGTMFGNALNMAAARAALEHVLTKSGYERIQALAGKLADGIDEAIKSHDLPWGTFRLGNRSGVCLSKTFPRNAAQARKCINRNFNYATRAFMANRGIWEPVYVHGPSISFAHSENDVEIYLSAFNELLDRMVTMR